MRMSTPLLASERRARLRELLAQDGAIRLESAAELLRVSAMTVRRDLADLEAEGVVRRVRGGAVAPLLPEPLYEQHGLLAKLRLSFFHRRLPHRAK